MNYSNEMIANTINKSLNKLETIITLTTIPPRFEQTAKNLESLLKTIPPNTLVVLNLPKRFQRFQPNPKGRKQLEALQKRFPNTFLINDNIPDMGPVTKIYPTLPLIKSQPINVTVLILDDEKYRPDAIERIIKAQYDDKFTVHSYWVYPYPTQYGHIIQVPQGVDIISTCRDILNGLEMFVNSNLEKCRYVDDLLLAEYFRLKGVPVKQIPRFWKWPWIPTHRDGGLFESGKRELQMQVCAKNFN